MTLPSLKKGYSRQTVADNIILLMREGYQKNKAIQIAYNLARCCFFARFPHGALDAWLAFPGHGRIARFYLTSGAPILRSAEQNPVRHLAIAKAEMAAIERGVQKQMSGKGADVRRAAALYTKFTGHTDPALSKLAVPPMPAVALEVGLCDGILYTTIRDNKQEKYIHKFKKNARPLLAASPDGKTLLLLGGAFNFTERGIVDD